MDKQKYERVRDRAYELWERAGQPNGKDVELWLEAEQEIEKGEMLDEGLEESFPDSDPPSSAMRSGTT